MSGIYVRQPGTTPWIHEQSMGSNRLVKLSQALDSGDAVNLGQLMNLYRTRAYGPIAVAFNLGPGSELQFYTPQKSIPCKLLFKVIYAGKLMAFEGVFTNADHIIYAICGDSSLPISFVNAGTSELPTISARNDGSAVMNITYIQTPL